MHAARKATVADIAPMAAALGRAFEDDPLVEHITPEKRRLERITRFYASELRRSYIGLDEVWTTPDHKGAALWAPPEKWRRPFIDVVRGTPTMVRVLGTRLRAGVAALNTIERNHPPGPHYYLAGLGTDPVFQGTGVGSALITPVLERCDQQGLGAYLESSKEKNIPFYGRHGFEVTRELALPGGGPSVWLMWREPR